MAHISYIDPDDLKDPELRDALHQAMLHSTPRPEIQAVRAHQPEVLRERKSRLRKKGADAV